MLPPELSIVVPAFNEERCIGACIRSLAGQEIDRTYEVILVDNNSTDATVAVARATANGLNLRVVHKRGRVADPLDALASTWRLGRSCSPPMLTQFIRRAGCGACLIRSPMVRLSLPPAPPGSTISRVGGTASSTSRNL